MLRSERSAAGASRRALQAPLLPLPLPHTGGEQPRAKPHDCLQPRHRLRTECLPVSLRRRAHTLYIPLMSSGFSSLFPPLCPPPQGKPLSTGWSVCQVCRLYFYFSASPWCCSSFSASKSITKGMSMMKIAIVVCYVCPCTFGLTSVI